MTPLSPPLGSGEVFFWRIDADRYAPTWHKGEGSFRVGGRWNSPGVRAVYTSLDPATAVLEVAVHKGFKALDTEAHTLTSGRIIDQTNITVVEPKDVPNPNWLVPCAPNTNQQKFGDKLLKDNIFILIPSAVSKNSWNMIFDASKVTTEYDSIVQERFSLDPRLQP